MNALVRAGAMSGRVWSDLCQCDSVSWLAAWQARLHRWLTQLIHHSLAHAIQLRENEAAEGAWLTSDQRQVSLYGSV